MLKNLRLNNFQFIILKCSRFCLFITFVFYFTLTVYTNILNTVFLIIRKEKKTIEKPTLPLAIKIFTFFQPSLIFNPPPRLLVLDTFFNPPTIPHRLSIRVLSVRTLSAICNITDESIKLTINLSAIFLELILSFLLCVSSDMETNSFTWLKLHTPILNLKLK